MKILLINEGYVTKKILHDKLEIFNKNAQVRIVEILDKAVVGSDTDFEIERDSIFLSEIKSYLSKRDVDLVYLNYSLGNEFERIIRSLASYKMPYCLLHNKFNKSHIHLFKQASLLSQIKRRVFLLRKWRLKFIHNPIAQFSSQSKLWKYDTRLLPGEITLIPTQDIDFILRKEPTKEQIILFIDSHLYGNSDFKIKLVEKETYLTKLRVDLDSLSKHLSLPFKIALHPETSKSDYLEYFTSDQLTCYKDYPIIPKVVISEGSNLFESLLQFSEMAISYDNDILVPKSQKHQTFLDYSRLLQVSYKLPTLTSVFATREVKWYMHRRSNLKNNSELGASIVTKTLKKCLSTKY